MTEDLESAILEFANNSTRDLANRVADKIASSELASLSSIADTARTPSGIKRLSELLRIVKLAELSLPEVAGIIKGAALAKARSIETSQIDLIWTGPSTNLISTRLTEPALVQIINASERKLFITSFVAYSFPTVLQALSNALSRNVEVTMLLESSAAHGGGVSFDVIDKMKTSLPLANIYSWDKKSDEYIGGKVHAKVAVADHSQCFISSANLTTHAMERNMEAGVIITGGDIPPKLHSHLEALVTTRVVSIVGN